MYTWFCNEILLSNLSIKAWSLMAPSAAKSVERLVMSKVSSAGRVGISIKLLDGFCSMMEKASSMALKSPAEVMDICSKPWLKCSVTPRKS